MTALLALALAAAPGCPGALGEADALAAAPGALDRARAIVEKLEAVGGGPVDAVRREAEALGDPPGRQQDPAAVARFRAALARHCALAEAPRAPGASEGDRAVLAAILSRPEYARRTVDPDALRRAILRLWSDLLERLGTSEAERWASTGRAIFLAAAAAGLALLLRAARRRARAPRAVPAPGPEEAAGAAAEPAPTPDDAARALAAGDAREAVRRAFLAALDALERAGRVHGVRTLTNAEVVAAVATSTSTPTLASELAALAALFDRTIYGGLPAASDDARAAVAAARAVASALAP